MGWGMWRKEGILGGTSLGEGCSADVLVNLEAAQPGWTTEG